MTDDIGSRRLKRVTGMTLVSLEDCFGMLSLYSSFAPLHVSLLAFVRPCSRGGFYLPVTPRSISVWVASSSSCSPCRRRALCCHAALLPAA